MSVTVKKMGGAKVELPIAETTTVGDLKAELLLELDVPLPRQRLLLKGKPLGTGESPAMGTDAQANLYGRPHSFVQQVTIKSFCASTAWWTAATSPCK